MAFLFNRFKKSSLTGSLIVFSLLTALFYTGNNIWLFTASYLFIIATLTTTFKQRFSQSIKVSLNGIFISTTLLLIWFAISIYPSQIKYLTLYNFFWVGSLIIIFLIFTLQDDQDKVWHKIWPGILLLVTLWAVYGLIQHYYLHVATNATFLNRNSLAALINLALIPTVAYFLLDETKRPWRFLSNKVLSLALILLFLATFIITSRGASVSLVLGFLILLFLLRTQIKKSQFYSLLIVVCIAFSIYYLSQNIFQISHTGFADRMITLKDTATAGNSRYIIWNSLIPLFENMPWYGIGLGSLWIFWAPFRPANDTSAGFFAHNDYMQITIEAGYPGIILLLSLFVFILLNVKRTLNTDLTKFQRFELVALFSALVTFAAHSFFTYNFYILPLLIIAGLYLGRIQQLVSINSINLKTIPALKKYFKPVMYTISLGGIVLILSIYFISISLSSHYNREAKQLMLQHKLQEANVAYLRSQQLAPLMDNPLFSHANLLRRGANKLLHVNKQKQANLLLDLALDKLAEAEKRNPLRPQIFHIRGLIYEVEQPEKAKHEFEKALKLNPRFLFSRIQLATLLHKEKLLKESIQVLYDGVNYTYPTNKVMLEYMQLFAKLSRESGVESFALHLEANMKQFYAENGQK